MKSSKLIMTTWLVVVGVLMFLAVRLILSDQGDTSGEDDGDGMVAQVDPKNGETGDDPTKPPRVRPDKPRPPRRTPHVKGRVLGPDGDPVAGAEVRVSLPVEVAPDPESADQADLLFISSCVYIDPLEWDLPRPLSAWLDNLKGQTAKQPGAEEITGGTTADDGTFDLEIPRHVGLGPFRVTAEASVGKASAQGVRPNVDIELTVGPVAAVTGVVLSGNENVGVPGATVVLDDGESRFLGNCADDGSFRIEGVSPGRYSVSAGAEGHSPLLDASRVVKSGEELALRLPRGTTVKVSAVYEPEEGPERPLADVDVVIIEQDTFAYVRGRTDLNGICEFAGLPPGSYLVNGMAERAVSFGEELVEVSGSSLLEEAELLFEPAIDTRVTVVDEEGQPVVGMEFYTGNVDEEYDALRSVKIDGTTDSQGRLTFAFEFEGPRALLFGFKKGFAMVRAYPDAHDDGIPMTLVARAALRVHGTVRTPEGRPIPDALVLLEIEPEDPNEIDDYLIQIRTNSQGKYDFPYLPRGEIWLSAELGDDAWSDDYEVELLEGQTEYQTDIELELE
jgi:hypothetical protein